MISSHLPAYAQLAGRWDEISTCAQAQINFFQNKMATNEGVESMIVKSFRWDNEKICHLLNCFNEYNSKLAYQGLDFDADRPLHSQFQCLMGSLEVGLKRSNMLEGGVKFACKHAVILSHLPA